ncbi:hypothetical protein L208DRAFT_1378046 [Tricholoma matsutake]|nr:hypothetical protein L208DRAFT_1378046 [Tricholoma matsutake 945]
MVKLSTNVWPLFALLELLMPISVGALAKTGEQANPWEGILAQCFSWLCLAAFKQSPPPPSGIIIGSASLFFATLQKLDRAYKARHMAYTMNKLVAIPSMSSMSACLGWPWATGGIDAGSNDVMVTLRVGVGLRVHQEGVADSAQRRRANFAN